MAMGEKQHKLMKNTLFYTCCLFIGSVILLPKSTSFQMTVDRMLGYEKTLPFTTVTAKRSNGSGMAKILVWQALPAIEHQKVKDTAVFCKTQQEEWEKTTSAMDYRFNGERETNVLLMAFLMNEPWRLDLPLFICYYLLLSGKSYFQIF
jgi:hypothetical protein